MKHEYVLTASADADMLRINYETIMRFGVGQSEKNEVTFQETFQNLADNPLMGHLREDLCPPDLELRFWTVLRRFLIVYQPIENGVIVARVFDGSQDVRSELAEDPQL